MLAEEGAQGGVHAQLLTRPFRIAR